tara:strand:- start:1030 stop:1335 length:306 start_codon:yes stop_codon:yes gene_type:complete
MGGGGTFTSDQVTVHAAATGTMRAAGRARITSINCAGIAASTLVIYDNTDATDATKKVATYKFGTEGLSVFVPGSGILCKTAIHAVLTANAAAGVTLTLTT